MIRIILLNIILASLYFWGLEHNRLICVALWAVAPLANLILWGLVENKVKDLFN